MVQEALRLGRRSLSEISDEAALEAELLLSCAMNMDRVTLYQQLNEQVSAELEVAYQDLLARRCSHEPTPYIVGRKEFYGIEFQVTPAAIIPRPETESLVEQVLAESGRIIARKSSLLIVDVGVGCGTIAIAIAANESRCDIIATDSSAEALALAEENAEKHGLAGRVDFIQGDGLQSLSAPVDMIVANLPYVRSSDWRQMPEEIRSHEPRGGLDGGSNGLRIIESVMMEAPLYLKEGGSLLMEIGSSQGEAIQLMASTIFPSAFIEISRDLAGLDRVLLVRNEMGD